MKIIITLLAVAFLLIAGVMISLLRSGGALQSAGVMKPAEISSGFSRIGELVTLRLFPEFDTAQHVLWLLEEGDESLDEIPKSAHAHWKGQKPSTLHDLRVGAEVNCVERCWYIQNLNTPLSDDLKQKMKNQPSTEILVQRFDRDEKVSEHCEGQKILDAACMRPVSVREVRRKIKTPTPHFFMRRYLDSQFYLYVEQSTKM